MTIICAELIALNDLQCQFEEVASEEGTSVFIKAREMIQLVEAMGETLESAKLNNLSLAADVADHILDFTDRRDLSERWIDAAFDGEGEGGNAFKARIISKLEALKESAEEFDRTKTEFFSIPPEQS